MNFDENTASANAEPSQKDILMEQLKQGVQSVIGSEDFKNYLSSMGNLVFNKYSFTNAMLLYMQKPNASYVMGYAQWKDFGRNVKLGAKGANIIVPVMAYENNKGGLYSQIKNSLIKQLGADPSTKESVYRLGQSNIEFYMNRSNQLISFRKNGYESGYFKTDESLKQFIDRSILGKVPVYFTAGTVFDIKDVEIPDYIWLKKGFQKHEIELDLNGNHIKNSKGETKIINTPERIAKLKTELDCSIVSQDPVKMGKLLDACVSVSERRGVHVYFKDKESDNTLESGAKGYFSRELSPENLKGYIVIDKDLEPTERCTVMLHEMGHADLHSNIQNLADKLGEERIPREMREVQAEAVAYMTAHNFGIETDISSFSYLASYSKGHDLQDLQKSLDVIYSASQALTKDLHAELESRGLNLDLTEKNPGLHDKESIANLSQIHSAIAVEAENNVAVSMNKLPSLISKHQDNPVLMDMLKEQKIILERKKENIDMLNDSIASLNNADTRSMQDIFISKIGSAYERLQNDTNRFNDLSEYLTPCEEITTVNTLKSTDEWREEIKAEKERSSKTAESGKVYHTPEKNIPYRVGDAVEGVIPQSMNYFVIEKITAKQVQCNFLESKEKPLKIDKKYFEFSLDKNNYSISEPNTARTMAKQKNNTTKQRGE